MVGSDGEQTRGPFGLWTWDFGEILPARNVRVCVRLVMIPQNSARSQ